MHSAYILVRLPMSEAIYVSSDIYDRNSIPIPVDSIAEYVERQSKFPKIRVRIPVIFREHSEDNIRSGK